MMRLACEYGAGWVTTGSSDPDDGVEAWWSNIAALSQRFEDVAAESPHAGAPLSRYLSVDASGVMALQSVEYFRECLGRAAELGFTDLIIHWPREDGVYAGSPAVLEAVAAEYLS